jgi:hypothetical protein
MTAFHLCDQTAVAPDDINCAFLLGAVIWRSVAESPARPQSASGGSPALPAKHPGVKRTFVPVPLI